MEDKRQDRGRDVARHQRSKREEDKGGQREDKGGEGGGGGEGESESKGQGK